MKELSEIAILFVDDEQDTLGSLVLAIPFIVIFG